MGYPSGQYIGGLIWFEHEINGETYFFSAQAGIGSYIETNEESFSIDFSRLAQAKGFKSLDSASIKFYDLSDLPGNTGLKLSKMISLSDGDWATFTLRCEKVQ